MHVTLEAIALPEEVADPNAGPAFRPALRVAPANRGEETILWRGADEQVAESEVEALNVALARGHLFYVDLFQLVSNVDAAVDEIIDAAVARSEGGDDEHGTPTAPV